MNIICKTTEEREERKMAYKAWMEGKETQWKVGGESVELTKTCILIKGPGKRGMNEKEKEMPKTTKNDKTRQEKRNRRTIT